MKTTVIALANQKGGVSKTTTAVNLGIGLARQGKKMLLVDADSQGNLTDSLGWKNPDALEQALPTVLRRIINDEPLAEFIADRESEVEKLCAERSRLNNRIRRASPDEAEKAPHPP